MLRVIYGGTFDPVHLGHVAVAEAAARALAPCALHLVPAADPPHRARPGATAEQRVAMLRLAFSSHPEFLIDERELRRSGPSYMVDTLLDLRAEFGSRPPLALLLGADAFLGLPSWHRWEEILDLCHLVLVPRPGTSLDTLPAVLVEACEGRWAEGPEALHGSSAGQWLRLDLPLRDESATHARRSTAQQTGSDAGLDPGVARFIGAAGLYRE
jgi:nicotinate-nucleotide adenylyltransferase